MNPRIRELMNQAVFTDQIPYPSQEQVFQKFAELFVRECIEVVEDSEGYSQYFPHVAKNIKKHFGVEE